MNIPVSADGTFEWCPPISAMGDVIELWALATFVAVMSACLQDMTPINELAQSGALVFPVTAAVLGA